MVCIPFAKLLSSLYPYCEIVCIRCGEPQQTLALLMQLEASIFVTYLLVNQCAS